MDELKLLERFHGHLGPYAVVGLMMGKYAIKEFGKENFKKIKVSIYTGISPPLSCIIDGVQVSGFTLGRGNINVLNKKLPKAKFFFEGRELSITLKKNLKKIIEKEMKLDERKIAMKIYKMKYKDIFNVKCTS
ncbi:MAG: formylmethanofuran dehydrogenase subunit E family protein [Candidatus Thermoplasmatota archaeon]